LTVTLTVSRVLSSIPSLTMSWNVRTSVLLTRGAVNVGSVIVSSDNVTVNSAVTQEPIFSPTSTVGAPSSREEHTAVWTGTEMIVWGGFDFPTFYDTGDRYDPATDTWTPMTTTGAPSLRQYHTAIWTGTEMIVWGGRFLDTGGIYDPSTDTWTPTTTIGAPTARNFHTAVWTGTEMLIWGGDTAPGPGGETDTGGRYDPSTDTWTSITTTGAPSARKDHTAVWTGTEMTIQQQTHGLQLLLQEHHQLERITQQYGLEQR